MSDSWIETDLPLGCVRIQTDLWWHVETLEAGGEARPGFVFPAPAQVTSSREPLARPPAHADFHFS